MSANRNSGIRKPSYRASMAPGGFQASRLSMLPVSHPRQSMVPSSAIKPGHGILPDSVRKPPRSSIRRSVVPAQLQGGPGATAPGTARKSRPSSFGAGMFQSSISQVATRDPRPVRDKGYQAQISEELLHYLSTHGFEDAMRIRLSEKSFKLPTQKEFVLIFQFLYHQLDPGYRFQKSIEHEAYFLLKALHYPYMESINKSQISAVGGQNWPVYLGMLYWLMQLNVTVENFDNDEFEGVEEPELVALDSIFIQYFISSYDAYVRTGEEDFPEFRQQVESQFESHVSSVTKDIARLEKANEDLTRRKRELEKDAEELENAKNRHVSLRSDVDKFAAYYETTVDRRKKWEAIMQKLSDEIDNAEDEAKKLQSDRAELEQHITHAGFTIEGIERMIEDRNALESSLDSARDRMAELDAQVRDKEQAAERVLGELQSRLQEYSKALSRLGVYSDGELEDPGKLEIYLDAPLSEENLGKGPQDLVGGKDITGLRSTLKSYKSRVVSRLHQTQDRYYQRQEEVDSLREDLADRTDRAERLKAQLTKEKIEYELIQDKMNEGSAAADLEIERFERDLGNMKASVNANKLQLDQRYRNLSLELDELRRNIEVESQAMSDEVTRLLSFAVETKSSVQNALQQQEQLVQSELEREQKRE